MYTSRPWPSIIKHYQDVQDTMNGKSMLRLVRRLDEAGYVKAGLHGGTSMHELLLSRSRHIFCGDPQYQSAEPRLRIGVQAAWFHGPIKCCLRYEDGSASPWEVLVEWDEVTERVERVLTKRLRWFK